MKTANVAATPDSGKGWFVGPWNSRVPVAVGWADRGVNEPHRHDGMNEIYLIARGRSIALVAGQQVTLVAGDMLVVEPGGITYLPLEFAGLSPLRRPGALRERR